MTSLNTLVTLSKTNAINPRMIYEIPANDPLLKDEQVLKFMPKFNRVLKPAHVNSIYNAIKLDPLFCLTMTPIEISLNSFNIIDGQHRLAAFRKLKSDEQARKFLSVRFITNLTLDQEIDLVAKKNSNMKNWTTANYVEKNLQAENAVEIAIDEFRKICIPKCQPNQSKAEQSYAEAILFGDCVKKECRTSGFITADHYDISDKNILEAKLRFDDIETVSNTILKRVANPWYRDLAKAWYDLSKSYQHVLNNAVLKSRVFGCLGSIKDYAPSNTGSTLWKEWLEIGFKCALLPAAVKS